MPAKRPTFNALTMKEGFPPLSIELKVTAREGPVVAGSPRALMAVEVDLHEDPIARRSLVLREERIVGVGPYTGAVALDVKETEIDIARHLADDWHHLIDARLRKFVILFESIEILPQLAVLALELT